MRTTIRSDLQGIWTVPYSLLTVRRAVRLEHMAGRHVDPHYAQELLDISTVYRQSAGQEAVVIVDTQAHNFRRAANGLVRP